VSAQGLFFPAAAAYAAVAVPLSVYTLFHPMAWLPGFATSAGHAQELLFGFALAVVAGFLINRVRRSTVGLLFVLWLGARVAFLTAPGSVVSSVLNVGFAALLLGIVVPPFLRAAKKWRNQAIAPILLTIGLALLVFHGAATLGVPVFEYRALHVAVLALALLMLFMGGRAIAPAAAGHVRRMGGNLGSCVQPGLEGAQLLLVAFAALIVSWPPARPLAGLALFAAAAVSLVRLLRWRFWLYLDRLDLTCLGIGYVWLVVGLVLLGAAYSIAQPALQVAVHAITVGALGTLTITMMARTRMIGTRRAPDRPPGLLVAVVAVAIAAVLRLGWPYDPTVLLAAALVFSLAYWVLFFSLLAMARSPAGASD
jgi:uncharacterized protein involved in response to NO